MYKDRKRLPNGRYEYLVECPDCDRERWIKDLRATRCKSCAKKLRAFNFCRVWPCHCKYCNSSMMLKSKPKITGLATCDHCKGKHGGRIGKPKEIIVKEKIKCSECPKLFEPRTKLIRTCSTKCSKARKGRIEREGRASRLKKIKKSTRTKDSEMKLAKPKKEKVILGGVDKKEKPIYIREREKKRFEFKEHTTKNGLTDNEISDALTKKFFKEGGKPSVTFEDSDYLNRSGSTECTRGGSHGY